jgi:hypothetical protein
MNTFLKFDMWSLVWKSISRKYIQRKDFVLGSQKLIDDLIAEFEEKTK